MGILRFILALAVVIHHVAWQYGSSLYGLRFTGGIVSVQTFYMLSGFYMALILNKKYTGKGSYKLFITNRFLRIFPAYWLVMLLSITLSAFPFFIQLFGFTVYDYVGNHNLFSPGSLAFLVITHLTLFGQETALFQGLDVNGHLYFTTNFHESDPALYTLMAVPQAWTLSIELMFYLIAPFLVRRNIYTLFSVVFASLVIRFYIYFFAGLYHDPWTYRFFPAELAFFLAGAISYRLYLMVSEKPITKKIAPLATVIVVCITLVFNLIPGQYNMILFALKQWFYYGLIFLLLPLLFIFSKSNRVLDGRIGELSYPIYLSHIFVMALLSPLLSRISPMHTCFIVCVATVIFTIILNRFFLSPIENYRQERVEKKGNPSTQHGFRKAMVT